MSPNDPRHGQERGYAAHRTDGEVACAACRLAHSRAVKRRTHRQHAGSGSRRPTWPLLRRVHALVALGWSQHELARRMGLGDRWTSTATLAYDNVHASTDRRVRTVYDELCMTLPPTGTSRERASVTRSKKRAQREGWPPPLAWDDIDDPAEEPALVDERGNYKRAELLNEFTRLTAAGELPETAARRLGVNLRTIERQRASAA